MRSSLAHDPHRVDREVAARGSQRAARLHRRPLPPPERDRDAAVGEPGPEPLREQHACRLRRCRSARGPSLGRRRPAGRRPSAQPTTRSTSSAFDRVRVRAPGCRRCRRARGHRGRARPAPSRSTIAASLLAYGTAIHSTSRSSGSCATCRSRAASDGNGPTAQPSDRNTLCSTGPSMRPGSASIVRIRLHPTSNAPNVRHHAEPRARSERVDHEDQRVVDHARLRAQPFETDEVVEVAVPRHRAHRAEVDRRKLEPDPLAQRPHVVEAVTQRDARGPPGSSDTRAGRRPASR